MSPVLPGGKRLAYVVTRAFCRAEELIRSDDSRLLDGDINGILESLPDAVEKRKQRTTNRGDRHSAPPYTVHLNLTTQNTTPNPPTPPVANHLEHEDTKKN